MKILFISYLFAPQNIIGALRPTKVAGELAERGHTVDVVTSVQPNMNEGDGAPIPENISSVTRLKKCGIFKVFSDFLQKFRKANANGGAAAVASSGDGAPARKSLYITIKDIMFFTLDYFENRSIVTAFKKYIKTVKNEKYDVIYCSFGPLSSLLCGMYAKKKFPDAKWICEFRDPVVTNVLPDEFKKPYKKIENKACDNADVIVAVSNGYVERICNEKNKKKAHMIPNGYDLKDKPTFNESLSDGNLKITYVGALYLGKRNLSPIFKAISELCEEKAVDLDKIAFEYAGKEFATAFSQAKKYGVQSIVHDNGVLSRKNCLDLQMNSDMLVLSTWNEKGEEGVFPGKFLEYMLIGKPIVSVVDGNIPESEVKQVMTEGNFGVTYEAANSTEDFALLKEYIKKQYDKVTNGENVEFEPNKDVLDRYNYENIMQRIEDLIK